MVNSIKKCEECGEVLRESQYARKVKDDGVIIGANEELVCRNYPSCSKAEKEVNGKDKI